MNTSDRTQFFQQTLATRDPEIFGAITKELGRQRDEIELIASENLAIERACRLFGCGFANVQPNSGSQAN